MSSTRALSSLVRRRLGHRRATEKRLFGFRQRQAPLDNGEQLRRLHRFEQEVGTQCSGLHLEAAIGVPGDDDDGNSLRIDGGEVQAIELGEPEVGDDQVGRLRLEQANRLRHRRCFGDVVASTGQELSHPAPRGAVVFDDQDSERHARR